LEDAGAPPQAEKSFDIGMEGAFAGAAGLGGGAVLVEVGSGVAQASLEPQASILENAEEGFAAAGCGATAFWVAD